MYSVIRSSFSNIYERINDYLLHLDLKLKLYTLISRSQTKLLLISTRLLHVNFILENYKCNITSRTSPKECHQFNCVLIGWFTPPWIIPANIETREKVGCNVRGWQKSRDLAQVVSLTLLSLSTRSFPFCRRLVYLVGYKTLMQPRDLELSTHY